MRKPRVEGKRETVKIVFRSAQYVLVLAFSQGRGVRLRNTGDPRVREIPGRLQCVVG